MHIRIRGDFGEKSLCVPEHCTILEALQLGGITAVHAPCGGRGSCKKCTVCVETKDGEQECLACGTRVEPDMTVRLPGQEALQVEYGLTERNSASSPENSEWGIACDIGTTTVVCQLIRMDTGESVAVTGAGNDQRIYGADVISRIQASAEGKTGLLTESIRKQLSTMILQLCSRAGIQPAEVSAMTVAANTVMSHLLAGLKPDSMGYAPYEPLSCFGTWFTAAELELPIGGEVYIAPAVSGFVGGDITADVLATGMDLEQEAVLLLDVGTNGEIVLGWGDSFLCCSTAAGPAFEGGQIRWGMTASAGAISAVTWKWGRVECETIGGVPARGICGSGLIDGISVLLQCGAVDKTGRMLDPDGDQVPEELEPYLYYVDGEPAFCLSGDVAITQSDVRKLQVAKAAIGAGVQVLRDLAGNVKIGKLLLAGGFGSYIRPESAARIGLIPGDLLNVTEAVGNAAVRGAIMALQEEQARNRLEKIRNSMDSQELSGMPQFSDAFIRHMDFWP